MQLSGMDQNAKCGGGQLVDSLLTTARLVDCQKHVALQTIQVLNPEISEIKTNWYPRFNLSKIAISPEVSLSNTRVLIELSNHRKTSQLENAKLIRILNGVFEQKNFSVVITLKSVDVKKAEELIQRLKMPAKFIVTPTLQEFISLVNSCEVFLLGDGGAAHIAGALGKRGVAVYGKTSVKLWSVLSEDVLHLYHEHDVNDIPDQEIKFALLGLLS